MCVLSCPQKKYQNSQYLSIMIGKLGVIHLRIITNLWVDQPKMRDTAPHLWNENRYPLVIQLWKIAMFNMVNLQWAFFHSYVKLPEDSNPKQMPKSWKTGKYENTSSKSWENVSSILSFCGHVYVLSIEPVGSPAKDIEYPLILYTYVSHLCHFLSDKTWQSNTMFQCFRLLDRARKRETSMGKTRSFPNQILGCWCLFYQPNTWGCLEFGNPKSPSCGSVICSPWKRL